jgi:hypothetical protein
MIENRPALKLRGRIDNTIPPPRDCALCEGRVAFGLVTNSGIRPQVEAPTLRYGATRRDDRHLDPVPRRNLGAMAILPPGPARPTAWLLAIARHL